MQKKILKINNEYGIHARPAALIVKKASAFESEIFFEKDENKVSCKSIMSLMTIEGYPGSEIIVIADGPDEEEALNAIELLFLNKFNEE